MEYQEAAPEKSNIGDTHPTPKEDLWVQAQPHNFVSYNKLVSEWLEDEGYDGKGWWSQMDALAEGNYTLCLDFSRYPEESRLGIARLIFTHGHPYSTRNSCTGCVLNVSMAFVSLKIMKTICNQDNAKSILYLCRITGMFHLPRNHKPWQHSPNTWEGIYS